MERIWTPEQWRFIEWRATPKYARFPPNQEMLANEIGVNDTTLYAWSKKEGFNQAVNKLARESLGNNLPHVYGALLREAEAGSFPHIQLILELTGEYIKKQHNVNQSDIKGEITLRFVDEEVSMDDDA